jgi:hypothetical protein
MPLLNDIFRLAVMWMMDALEQGDVIKEQIDDRSIRTREKVTCKKNIGLR